MTKAATACFMALFLIVPGPVVARANAGSQDGSGPPACVAERDKALRTLDEAALGIETAIDADVAIADAPEYELLEAKKEQLGAIEQERRDVLERYRRCAGNQARLPPR
jgi:hypothetical protein